MLTHTSRRSHVPGNRVVPSRWQATAGLRCSGGGMALEQAEQLLDAAQGGTDRRRGLLLSCRSLMPCRAVKPCRGWSQTAGIVATAPSSRSNRSPCVFAAPSGAVAKTTARS